MPRAAGVHERPNVTEHPSPCVGAAELVRSDVATLQDRS